jgi:hypothetical protein
MKLEQIQGLFIGDSVPNRREFGDLSILSLGRPQIAKIETKSERG